MRGDGTVVFFTYNYADEADPMSRFVRAWLAAPDGALTELALPDELQALYSVANLCFLADGTLVFTPLSYERRCRGIFCFMMSIANRSKTGSRSVRPPASAG